MNAATESALLESHEKPAAEVVNGRGSAPAVLVCEHASRFIPASLDGLGLTDAAATSHAAWDIGALDLAGALAQMMDAPLVAARVSRLVYDCNRPPEAPGAIPAQSEVFTIPGNANLNDAQRAARVAEVYDPFRALVAQVLDRHPDQSVMITIHSFTPVYNGQTRDVELGILHDADDRVAKAVLARARQNTPLKTEMNQPYSATDGVTHTLRMQAGARGLANVMIEVRNDLIDTPQGVARVAGYLAPILNDVVREFSGTAKESKKA